MGGGVPIRLRLLYLGLTQHLFSLISQCIIFHVSAQSLQDFCPHITGEVLGTKTTVFDDDPQAEQIRIIRLVKEGTTPLVGFFVS